MNLDQLPQRKRPSHSGGVLPGLDETAEWSNPQRVYGTAGEELAAPKDICGRLVHETPFNGESSDDGTGGQRKRQALSPTGKRPSDEDDENPNRRKIKINYITEKAKRHITFSKRKAGIMKKAYELSTLTGTQLMLLVVSESGWVYTFTTDKFKQIVRPGDNGDLSLGQRLIAQCLETEIPADQAPVVPIHGGEISLKTTPCRRNRLTQQATPGSGNRTKPLPLRVPPNIDTSNRRPVGQLSPGTSATPRSATFSIPPFTPPPMTAPVSYYDRGFVNVPAHRPAITTPATSPDSPGYATLPTSAPCGVVSANTMNKFGSMFVGSETTSPQPLQSPYRNFPAMQHQQAQSVNLGEIGLSIEQYLSQSNVRPPDPQFALFDGTQVDLDYSNFMVPSRQM